MMHELKDRLKTLAEELIREPIVDWICTLNLIHKQKNLKI
jgi:hypothetical protein